MGVIDDPYSTALLTPLWSGFAALMPHMSNRFRPGLATFAGLAARVKWYDLQVVEALRAGITQVAVIGAGYDTRTWRFREDGVTFFELDHPVTQHDKRNRAVMPGPTYVEADLTTTSAMNALASHGFDPASPALFIIEGVTMYLTKHTVQRQLRDLAEACTAGTRLAIDFYPPTNAGTPLDRRQILYQKLFRAGSGEGFKLVLDLDEARDLVETCGWDVLELTSLRTAAKAFVPAHSQFPVELVNGHKALIAAVVPG